jgi:dihydrodipicolinate synthase/N-acetylneuraminate lyase
MTGKPPHRGVIVPIVSPFHEDGAPDTAAVKRLADYLIAAAVDGIFVLGTTGEAESIPPEDKPILIRAAVNAVAGRAPVYAGVSGNSLRQSVELAAECRDLGAAAVVAHPPFYFPISDRELEIYFRKLADALPLPLILYNIPKTTHITIPPEIVERLSRHGNIVGLKDSAHDLLRFKGLAKQFSNREDFSLLCGCSAYFGEALELGAHGLVPSTANYAPDPFVEMCRAAHRQDWREVAAQFAISQPFTARFQEGRSLGDSIAALKQILAEMKICGKTVLPPLRDYPGDTG